MDSYSQFKIKIQHRSEILEETIREIESAGLAEDTVIERWRGQLRLVSDSLTDPFLRVAVAGSVKSGKSTLVNAVIGQDLLKRGSGIITAFITRVITSEKAGGWIALKSWRQINEEVNASVRMLPLASSEGEPGELDLRDPGHRDRISLLLGRMKSECLQAPGTVDPHFIFLERCLSGFPLVADEINEESNPSAFDAGTILRHQLYVGEENRSVWVRDVELQFPVPWMGERIELADCQGSDSPNPTHFELLQKYLLRSHFILYVIGSRTGLREADFRLLHLLRALRMLPQTIFVLNLDYDAHNDREDIEKNVERVRSELSWIVPDPMLFPFSCLFQLLKQLGDKAPKPERRRMKLWKESKTFAKLGDAGFEAFRKELDGRIRARRSQLVLGSGLSRLEMIATNIQDSVRIRSAVLEQSAFDIRETAEQLRTRHTALQSTLEKLADTIAGLNQNLKLELAGRIDACFDPAHGAIVREAIDLVDTCPGECGGRPAISDYGKLLREYYGFYLQFRRDLTRRLADRVNLRIMELVKGEESLLQESLRQSSRALWGFFEAAIADYRRDILGTTSRNIPLPSYPAAEPDFSRMTPPPPFSTFMERGSIIRGILFLKFGLSSFSGLLSGIKAKMQKKTVPDSEEKYLRELFERVVRHIQGEARAELLRATEEFHREFKTAYLFRIVDEGCIFLLREFKERAEMVRVDFSNLLHHSELKGEQRTEAVEVLRKTAQITTAMIEDLADLRRDLGTALQSPEEWKNPEERALK